MKTLMLAGLAVLAAPALAQTTPAPDTSSPQATPAPAPIAPSTDSTTTTPAAPTDSTMSTPNAPSTPTSATTPMASSTPPATASGSYPVCSRTVTDSCTERSNARGERLHSTPRKR